ncbi:hypothetical protein [uncultured Cetobacterium sp.]|uniref:hypothetical protein n=1 Tax=uncultured Cetobacterium sp. TaxID=527638 RepID=UPI002629B933|nr:hypothetical protein [uncultured Cetobacterium sp.]
MKKLLLFLLALSTLSYSTPKVSYKTGAAYALREIFNSPAKKILVAGQVVQLDENLFAQKIKYQTYSDFGGQIIKENIFIFKKIESSYKFLEKLNVEDIEL